MTSDSLRQHGLTFDFVANAVRAASLDLPGGSMKTTAGEILIRTQARKYTAPEFEEIVVLTRPDGTRNTSAVFRSTELSVAGIHSRQVMDSFLVKRRRNIQSQDSIDALVTELRHSDASTHRASELLFSL